MAGFIFSDIILSKSISLMTDLLVKHPPPKRRQKQGCQMVYVFAYQKIPIWENFAVLGIENICTFYCHWEYYTDIWNSFMACS
jgi:hypothetical protein